MIFSVNHDHDITLHIFVSILLLRLFFFDHLRSFFFGRIGYIIIVEQKEIIKLSKHTTRLSAFFSQFDKNQNKRIKPIFNLTNMVMISANDNNLLK